MLHDMWDLPGPGIEPVPPALVGGFFTTEPPGNPCINFSKEMNYFSVEIIIISRYQDYAIFMLLLYLLGSLSSLENIRFISPGFFGV